jgi:hypothetical protein
VKIKSIADTYKTERSISLSLSGILQSTRLFFGLNHYAVQQDNVHPHRVSDTTELFAAPVHFNIL